MRFWLTLLLLTPLALFAANRSISDCSGYVTNPSEGTPFELDDCTIVDGDTITDLLIDIAELQADGNFYANAPSASGCDDCLLYTDSIDWARANGTIANEPASTYEIDGEFYFNNHASNPLKIHHVTSGRDDDYIIWYFNDPTEVKIGGTALTLTFEGTHPGLVDGVIGDTDANKGILHFVLDDSQTDHALVDVRANFRHAWQFGVYFSGGTTIASNTNRWQQVNIAGTFWNAGLFFHSGVRDAWLDPTYTIISDPFVRTWGYDGTLGTNANYGCSNRNIDEIRQQGGPCYYCEDYKGGLTLKYGGFPWNMRLGGNVGTSADDPFYLKVQNWGASGPEGSGCDIQTENCTAVPQAIVKPGVQPILWKGDPHIAGYARYIDFSILPGDTVQGAADGWGIRGGSLTNCENQGSDTPQDANTYTGGSNYNLVRLECNTGTSCINTNWNIVLSNLIEDATSDTANFMRLEPYNPDSAGDRSHSHTVSVSDGETAWWDPSIEDTVTVEGFGNWTDISIVDTAGNSTTPQDNTIQNTNVDGTIDIVDGATGTVINNVDFTGGTSAREIIDVDGTSTAIDIDNICTAANDYITCLDANDGNISINGATINCPADGSYELSALDGCDVNPETKLLLLIGG